MKLYILQLGDMGNCTYIIDHKGEGLIIDPAWNMKAIQDFVEEEKIQPKAVLFTHGHYDHVTGANELMEKYNIKGYMEASDADLSQLKESNLVLYDRDHKERLAGLDIEFISTPGHTRGSVCIKIRELLFTGDTLFPNACGRTDMPGGDSRELLKSLRRLAALPPETIVYSGHSYGPDGNGDTTIGKEIKNNPFVKMALREPDNFEDMF